MRLLLFLLLLLTLLERALSEDEPQFFFQSPLPLATNLKSASSVTRADLNGDSSPDILFAAQGVFWVRFEPEWPNLPMKLSSIPQSATLLVYADFNHDDHDDLIVYTPPFLQWYHQIEASDTEPSFNLTYQVSVDQAVGPGKVVVKDFNDDGHDDVAFNTGSIFRFFLTGEEGIPVGSKEISLTSAIRDYEVTQIDPNDEYQSVVFLLETLTLEMAVYSFSYDDDSEIGPTITFNLTKQFSTGLSPTMFVISDATGDHVPDLLVVSAGRLAFLESNGTFGSFLAPRGVDSSLNQVSRMAMGDLNQDGTPDIVAVSNGTLYTISEKDGQPFTRKIYDNMPSTVTLLLTQISAGDYPELLVLDASFLFFYQNKHENHASNPSMFFMHSAVSYAPQPMRIWDTHHWYFDVYLSPGDSFYFDVYGNHTLYFGQGDSDDAIAAGGLPINVTISSAGIFRVAFHEEEETFTVVSNQDMFEEYPFTVMNVAADSASIDMITSNNVLEINDPGYSNATQAAISFTIPNPGDFLEDFCIDRFGLVITQAPVTTSHQVGPHKFLIKSLNSSFWEDPVASHLGSQLNSYQDVAAGFSQINIFTKGIRYIPLPFHFLRKAVKQGADSRLSLSLEIIDTPSGYLAFQPPSPNMPLTLDISVMHCPQFSTCGSDNICTCDSGYFGNYSDCVPDPCVQRPCLNAGTCTPLSEHEYTCACRPGWLGHNCEIEEPTAVHLSVTMDVTVGPDGTWEPDNRRIYFGGTEVAYSQLNSSALLANNFCINFTTFYVHSGMDINEYPMHLDIIGLKVPWYENLTYQTLPPFTTYASQDFTFQRFDGDSLQSGYFRFDLPGKQFRTSPFPDTFSYRISSPTAPELFYRSKRSSSRYPFAVAWGIRCSEPNTQCSALIFPDEPISCICKPGFVMQNKICTRVVTLIPPQPTEITPLLSSYLGTNVTVRGKDFLPGMALIVMAPVTNETIAQFNFPNPTQISSNPDIYQITFTAPIYNVTGYVQFKFWNVLNGGSKTIEDFYYTEDCPFHGQYGIGLTCRDCPVGAICPGGNRMWPDKGYWTYNETVGYVLPCPAPSDRCVGGRFSECEEGYQGELCGSCASDFYSQNGICLQCTGFGSTAILFLADIVVSVILVITTAFMRTSIVRVVTLILSFSQILRTSGRLIEPYLPAWMLPIYSVLSLSALDPEFSRPGCLFGDGDFFVSFYWTLVFLFSAIVLIAVCVILETFVFDRFALRLNNCFSSLVSVGTSKSTLSMTSLTPKETNTYITVEDFMAVDGGDIDIYEGDLIDAQNVSGQWGKGKCHRTGRTGRFPMQCVRSTDKRHTHSFDNWQARSSVKKLFLRAWRKWIRGTVIFLSFSYSSIALRSFQGVYCFRSGDKYVIGAQQDQECFSDPHLPIFSISVALLTFYVVGLPLGIFLILFKNRHQLHNHRLRHSFGYIYSHFEEKYFYFGLFWLAVLMFQSLGVALNTSSLTQTLISGISVGVFLLLVLATRPFKARSTNATAMVLLSGALILIILSSLSLTDRQLLAIGLTYIIASLVGFAIVLFYPLFDRVFCSSKSRESEGSPSDEKEVAMENVN